MESIHEAVRSLMEPVNTLASSICILTDPNELKIALEESNTNVREAKVEFEQLLEEKKRIDHLLKIDHERECDERVHEHLVKNEQKTLGDIESTKKALEEASAQLEVAKEKRMALGNRRRTIKKQLKLLASRDGIEEILYDKLTEEKKDIDANLKDIDEEIAELTKTVTCESKALKILNDHRDALSIQMLELTRKAKFGRFCNLKESALDIKAKIRVARNKVFDCLESHRNLEDEYKIIEKLANENSAKNVVSDLNRAKRKCIELLGPDPESEDECKKPKY